MRAVAREDWAFQISILRGGAARDLKRAGWLAGLRGILRGSLANHRVGGLSSLWAWRFFTKEPYVETGDDRGAGGAGGGWVAADGMRVSGLPG